MTSRWGLRASLAMLLLGFVPAEGIADEPAKAANEQDVVYTKAGGRGIEAGYCPSRG